MREHGFNGKNVMGAIAILLTCMCLLVLPAVALAAPAKDATPQTMTTSPSGDEDATKKGSDTEVKPGWVQGEDKKWRYATEDGTFASGWQLIDNGWFYLDPSDNNTMKTGWFKWKDNWYYFKPGDSGRMLTGWQKIGNNWYYLKGSGQMKTGWLLWEDNWYYFKLGDSGRMLTGWQKIDDSWYYFKGGNSGQMKMGWLKLEDDWFYLDPQTGKMLTEWQLINDAWYFFKSGNSGKMLTEWLSWEGYWYYLSPETGKMLHGGWEYVGDVEYKFSSSGAMVGAYMNVPCLMQNPELPTGCESVALTNAMRYYGLDTYKTTIADFYLPRSGSDFVTAFTGDPHSGSGGQTCAPGITYAANKYLSARGETLRAKEITGTSFYYLCYDNLVKGQPVIIWTSIGHSYAGSVYASQYYNGRTYNAFSLSHTVVLAGFDSEEGVVWISDSISGKIKLGYSHVQGLYNKHGKQAVVLYEPSTK